MRLFPLEVYCGRANIPKGFEINNGLIGASPGHPLLEFCLERLGTPWAAWGGKFVDPMELILGHVQAAGFLAGEDVAGGGFAPFIATTGPGFFTRAVCVYLDARGTEGVCVLPPDGFCPCPNDARDQELSTRQQFATERTWAIHHWARTWAS